MSTKIYDGFKFNTTDLYEIHEYAMNFRTRAREHVKDFNLTLIANLVTSEIDKQTMGIHSLKDENTSKYVKSPLHLATSHVEDDRRTGGKDYYSVSFNVMVFPIVDTKLNIPGLTVDKHTVLGMTFTSNQGLLKIWQEGEWYDGDFTSFYGYWDNTDPDENCTEKEWAERHRLWHKSGICDQGANMCGFMIEGTNSLDSIPFGISAADVLEKVHERPFEKRIKHIAKELAAGDFPLKDESGSTSEFMRYMNSKEYKASVAKYSEEVAKKLKEKLTREDLLNDE